MSYCRWSSDNFRSDVYVYAHVDGTWTTHVAGARHKLNKKARLFRPKKNIVFGGGEAVGVRAYIVGERANRIEQNGLIDNIMCCPPLNSIFNYLARQTFKDPTPWRAAMTLRRLRAAGLRVPNGVIERLKQEALMSPSINHREEIHENQ